MMSIVNFARIASALLLLCATLYLPSVQAQCPTGTVADTLNWDDPTLGWQTSMNGSQGPHTLYTTQGVKVTVTYNNVCGATSGVYSGGTPGLDAGGSGGAVTAVDWTNNTNCSLTQTLAFSVNGTAYTAQNVRITIKDVDQITGSWDDRIVFTGVSSVSVGANITAITNGGHGNQNCTASDTTCWITGTWNSASSIQTVWNPGPQSPSNPAGQVIVYSDVTLCVNPATTPVTLDSFKATAVGDAVVFDWSTATEAGNLGFNLYGEVDGQWQRLNDQIIASHAVNTTEPQSYDFTAPGVTATRFQIADLDIHGKETRHGPYALNESFGRASERHAIDWRAIRAEHENKRLGARADKATLGALKLLVRDEGIYRVGYEALKAAGLDLAGVKAKDIALTNRGQPVLIAVTPASGAFGPGSVIDFIGKGLDSLYSADNVYLLRVDPTKAARIRVNAATPPTGVAPVSYYLETATVARQRQYSFAAPLNDPWFDDQLIAIGAPLARDYSFTVDHYRVGAAAAKLNLHLWGVTDFPQNPDHHVIAALNGVQIADKRFDGLVDYPLAANLAAGSLREGANTLTLKLAADTGAEGDVVNLEGFSVTYPRAFVASGDKLRFTAAGSLFQAGGFSSEKVLGYRQFTGGRVESFKVVTAPSVGGFQASFAGSTSNTAHYLATTSALLSPRLEAPAAPADLTSGPARYLIIAHPDFIGPTLNRLVQARETQGYSVKVVNVEAVYAQYSAHIKDAQAIRDYIAFAKANLATEYVLLVGGDTYDYKNYLGQDSVSFVPSLYAQTDAIVRYAPVDALYADTNRDNIPDLAIGRLPVRTTAELATLIDQTLAYEHKTYGQTAVLAADALDLNQDLDFKADSETTAVKLPGWRLTRAYIDDLGVAGARAGIIDGINQGAALVSYFGHSGPTEWTFSGLFRASDVSSLTNVGRPTIVTQWGCWNTYYVSPNADTLGHRFLLSGNRGAAAVLGASALTDAGAEAELANLLFDDLVAPGVTLGQAIINAKQAYGALKPAQLDVLLGWNLLGDPALMIEP